MIPITHPFRKVREKDGAPGYNSLTRKRRRVAHITESLQKALYCLDQFNRGVPLDKSEGSVKDKNIPCSTEHRFALPERLRTKALEISR
jgi:hypothetical protein